MPPNITNVANAQDFLRLAESVTAPDSPKGAEVTNPEYKMLEKAYQGLPEDEQRAARLALRRNFPELHGAVVNDHK